MERKKVLVAFGDVRGSTSFFRRAMNSLEEKRQFLDALYREFEKMTTFPDYYVKYNGDGILVIRELDSSIKDHSGVAYQFLRHNYVMAKKVLELTERYRRLRFRLRAASGEVFKISVLEGSRGGRRRISEYTDYAVGLAAKLKAVYADEHLCICHLTMVELLKKKNNELTLTKLSPPPPEQWPSGLDEEDLSDLFSFSFNDERKPKESR